MKDSTAMYIKGAYTDETDSATIRRIFQAMQSVYYDEDYKVDERTSVPYQLNDSNSVFKYAGRDGLLYWYTRKGKKPELIEDEPYFLLFLPWRFGTSNSQTFFSYKKELEKPDWGFIFQGTQKYQSRMLAKRNAHEYLIPATDIYDNRYLLFLTEVDYDSQTLVMLGVTVPGDQKSIEEFRKLAGTLVIFKD